VWHNLGFSYGELKEYDKAISANREAIRLKPDYVDAWYDLGYCYAAQGDRSNVMKVYKKLKTLDPKGADDFFRDAVHQ
jgi:tetratricopeptide (TPR) repeat protein